ncbi:NAD(P)/FAD-dependent oxidoreductase [Vibrio sp.]|uniref:NAD(P)/FAD-dependent oxidoreductase n=1 Tax=Vibrio sp. TaxID=678 RepID=UPI003D143D96
MKIAIIGSGISGLTCGYHLHRHHDVTVFEASDYIGGHTATVDVQVNGQDYAVDTGFIVFNDRTYPNFMAMLDKLGVRYTETEMSFSVRNDYNGLEYNGHTLATMFAQKRNLFSPRFYYFIWEILRFNRLAKQSVDQDLQNEQTLGEFLQQHGFSDYFSQNYILPMGAAIWSSTLADMRASPLPFFIRFFLNHGLLDVTNRPQWYVLTGGSRSYIGPMTQGFSDRILLRSPVTRVTRTANGVSLLVNGEQHQFDQVIFACHSDQALAMLADASPLETETLSAMAYQANDVILHTDTRLLPKRKSAWAAWNYWIQANQTQPAPRQEEKLPSLTYNMNCLQHIEAEQTFCVSLNCLDQIDQSKVLRKFSYHHPVFTRQSVAAQANKSSIDGVMRSWFCGAYWYNGFHEDGVRSALDVVAGIERLSAQLEQGAA